MSYVDTISVANAVVVYVMRLFAVVGLVIDDQGVVWAPIGYWLGMDGTCAVHNHWRLTDAVPDSSHGLSKTTCSIPLTYLPLEISFASV
jgi:hypothetical protein